MGGAQRAILGVTLVSFMVSTSGVAHADEWYGQKILAGDGAAALLLVSSFAVPKKAATPFRLLSLATYLVVSPVVHGIERRGDIGVGALGLRIVAPLGLGLLGAGIGAGAGPKGMEGLGTTLIGGFIGLSLGVLTAIAIDTAALARTPTPVGQTSTALLPGPSVFVPFGAAF